MTSKRRYLKMTMRTGIERFFKGCDQLLMAFSFKIVTLEFVRIFSVLKFKSVYEVLFDYFVLILED